MSNCTMKTYDVHYSVHVVDGKLFKLIECSTWPRLNVQVIDTTPDRFEDDLKVIKSRSLCGYSPHDKTFILKHAGGEGNGELNQSNVHEILNGMKEIMNAAVKWWMKNKKEHIPSSPSPLPLPQGEGSRMRDIPVIREEKMFVITPNRVLKKNTMEIE